MDVITRISTPRDKTARLSDVEIRKLRALPYADYLQTVWWQTRRDRALRQGGWRCARCDNKRELQVHHKTYANKGCERDEDLEVICRPCHEGHHFTESRKAHLGVYVRLVSEVLSEGPTGSLSELIETVKERCVHARIPYNGQRVSDAVALVYAGRGGARVITPRWPVPPDKDADKPDAPITRQDAAAIVKRLGIAVPFRSIPNAAWSDPDAFEREDQRRKALDSDV